MVSSYLICDLCGQFGPPASFLSQDGLRVCYQCWHREQQEDTPGMLDPAPDPASERKGKNGIGNHDSVDCRSGRGSN